MKYKFKNKFILGAILSAILATSCCLSALILLIFGSSFAMLSIFEPLSPYRWLFSSISLLFFILFLSIKFSKNLSCNSKNNLKNKIFTWINIFILAFILVFLLFYPEILGNIYE